MAELSAERLRALPGSWSYGISQGGRVFCVCVRPRSEEAKSTTWLHPLTGEAVITGHRRSADLPTGWEEAYTFEGARYYVNTSQMALPQVHTLNFIFCQILMRSVEGKQEQLQEALTLLTMNL
ncbi:LOW QUALITY PROTEIN: pleckstrin homology domain-containing family A member 5-like [Poecile atricapillus]|uniref:LOW QUALITY PROTEIN: pleckstrin homology domain-containing family A member 5-like n=1 Tax=Poecile atricapillus TaxID=48891 RepID=UPI0027389C36|nr:LOW QUALITY PROTEIN: pleckstrin homology domain-containing family A member 5-like [Poecile atricapillus]XP_058708975.1 LOW QUALITY PROTEIN: pleckstrin homology domain-containing family A member 5-like [Poecile atricapillus]XP_058709057.1 LOW QUALITY PROTEIN: pleckstrin homology domain-containing family A member 5-like [Poecile atricapillus]XP_058709061.1 LOW QUALITY PROTEIN: pleckstrin homology domain-containing family A member 5-like [Poecile atricapillus]XP_058709086.1 LOW QUALITY PROTEIN: